VSPKQLLQAEIERFPAAAAEALHTAMIGPLISPHCNHYRATRVLCEALLKTVREVTGKEVAFERSISSAEERPHAKTTEVWQRTGHAGWRSVAR